MTGTNLFFNILYTIYNLWQYSFLQLSTWALQYGLVRYSTVQCGKMLYSAVQCCEVRYSAVQCGTVQ
jgi:hypothetical protein